MINIEQIESNLNISEAIEYIEKENCTVNEYLRLIFVITYFLKEKQYSSSEYCFYTSYLRKSYIETLTKFSENPEFLFL